MKMVALLLLTLLSLVGCVADKGKTVVNIKRNPSAMTQISSASVSTIAVVNNQIIVSGNNLNVVSGLKINGTSFSELFTIESKTSNQIVANANRAFSFDISKIFELVLSDAYGAATFPIAFDLTDGSVTSPKLNAMGATVGQVLKYDGTAWVPSTLSNSQVYLGTYDANSNSPDLSATSPIAGDYYIVTTAGTYGADNYEVGDWIMHNGSAWEKISNSTNVVSSFNGRRGIVTPAAGDYSWTMLTSVAGKLTGSKLEHIADIDLTGIADNKILKWDATNSKWIIADDLSGGGAGSVTSTEIADASVTNADISATAAIDYSKLAIADGDIPMAKVNGLSTALSGILAPTIVDADTTHAPDGNAVFDALGLKLNLTGGTLTVGGTITGLPALPLAGSEATSKDYVDGQITTVNTAASGKVAKTGDTMSGVLTLDNDLKIKGGSNYVTVRGHATSAAYNMVLPSSAGTGGYVLSTDGAGNTSWINPSTVATGTGTVNSASITDGSIVDADINASAAIAQSKIANLTTDLAGKEPTLTAGTALQYYRGDKTWQALDTTAVAEGTNLYFLNSRVLGVDLAGLNTGVAGPIAATDTVLGAFGKLQYQVTDLKAKGQWEKNVNDIYYNTGNVGIGTNAPGATLQINSTGNTSGTYGLIVRNSTPITNFYIRDDGQLSAVNNKFMVDPNGYVTSNGKMTVYNNVNSTNVVLSVKANGSQLSNIQEWQNSAGTALSVVDKDGQVGIGTSAPTEKLEIADGSIKIAKGYYKSGVLINYGSTTSGGGPPISAIQAAGTGGESAFNISRGQIDGFAGMRMSTTGVARTAATPEWFTGITGNIGVGAGYNFNIAESTDSAITSRLVVLPGGNVGIGSAAPSAKLEVGGTIKSTSNSSLNLNDTVFTYTTSFNTSVAKGAYLEFFDAPMSNQTLSLSFQVMSLNYANTTEFYSVPVNYDDGAAAIGTVYRLLPTTTSGKRSDATTGWGSADFALEMVKTSATQMTFRIRQVGDTDQIGSFPYYIYITSVKNPGTVKTVTGTDTANYNYPIFRHTVLTQGRGKVGIGVANPQAKLDVNGAIKVGADGAACSATIAGAMRFNTPNVEYCNGTAWTAFSAIGAAVASAQITDGTIVDADISATANIAQSKIANLGSDLAAKQALDTTLTSLAAFNTNGILVQTAADTFVGRSIAGTANRTVVTNGDGVAGNPTINLDTTLLPSPLAGDAGKFLKASGANASAWSSLASGDITTALGFTPVNKAGDSFTTGTFALSGTAALTVQNPVNLLDAANKQYVDSYGQWTKSGSDIYRAGGNVGVGISVPLQKLEVAGTTYLRAAPTFDATVEQLRIGRSDADLRYHSIYSAHGTSDATNFLQFRVHDKATSPSTNQTTVMTMLGSGNVGVGTATPAQKLSVAGVVESTTGGFKFPDGTVQLTSANTGTNNTMVSGWPDYITCNVTNPNWGQIVLPITYFNYSGNSLTYYRIQIGGTTTPASVMFTTSTATQSGYDTIVASDCDGKTIAQLYASGKAFNVAKGPAAQWLQSGSSAYYNAGNVGIGSTNPTSQLHMRSLTPVLNLESTDPTAYTGGVLRFGHDQDGSTVPIGEVRGLLTNGSVNREGYLGFYTSIAGTLAERFRIEGKWFKTRNTPLTSVPGGWGGGLWTWDLYGEGTIALGTNGAQNVSFNANGNGSMIGTLTQSSDRRLKEEIEVIDGSLEKLMQLEGVYYFWKDRSAGRESKQIGLIAQDVQKVFPQAVRTESNGYLAVAYQNLVAPIINSIKEIYRDYLLPLTENDKVHDRKIASLEKENQKLQNENTLIKEYLCQKDPRATFCVKGKKLKNR